MQKAFLTKRAIAAGLTFALVLAAPGPGVYAAGGRAVSNIRAGGLPALNGGGLLHLQTGEGPRLSLGKNLSLRSNLPDLDSIILPQTFPLKASAAGIDTPKSLVVKTPNTTIPAAQKNRTAPIINTVTAAVHQLEQKQATSANRSRILRGLFDLSHRKSEASPTLGAESPRNQTLLNAASSDAAAPAQEIPSPQSKTLKLGRNALFFIAALVLAQMGAEAVGAALPTLIEKSFGDFATTLTHLVILTYVVDFLGRQIAPWTIKKLGLKKTFLTAHGAKFVSMGALAGLLGAGMMTLPLLQAFILASAFMGGITATVEQSIPPAIVGRSRAALEHYLTREQAFRSVMSIGGPIGTGALVVSFGFLPAFLIFPIATAATLFLVWKFVKILPRLDDIDPEEKKASSKLTVTRGVSLVWKTPALRYAAAMLSTFAVSGTLLFVLMIPAYGLNLAGPGMEELATGIYGWIIGLFNVGGLLGMLTTMRSQKKMGKRVEKERLNKAAIDKLLMRSLLRWVLFAIVGLAAMTSFLVPLPTLGALAALPPVLSWASTLTLPSIALIPMGFVTVVAGMKLRSFFQSHVPSQDDMPHAMAFLGALTIIVQAISLFFMKFLFTNFTGVAPFIYASYGLIPIAAVLLLITHRIKHSTETKGPTPPPSNAADPQGRFQTTPLHKHPATSIGSEVIAPDQVPGYTAIFNGDVEVQTDGSWLGVFRMARGGYFRSPTAPRELRPYLSDLGWFKSSNEGKDWEFVGLAAVAGANEKAFAARLELRAQGHREDKARYPNQGAQDWHNSQITPIERTLTGLYDAPGIPIDRGFVLEDGRFHSARDSKGVMRKFIFATRVHAAHLDPRIGGPTPPQYRMAAMERTDDGLADPMVFGPMENKDTWVINITPSRRQKRQMRKISRLLKTPLDPQSAHPIAVGLRLEGRIQLVPLDSLERMLEMSLKDWEKIVACDGCFSTIVSPSKGHRSVGSSDQPKPVTGRPGLYWHFYHQTSAGEDHAYSSWVEILDASGRPRYRLPYAIETPDAYYYRHGDISNVVFNSGNVYLDGKITHINGAADKAVVLSQSDENELLAAVMRHPVR